MNKISEKAVWDELVPSEEENTSSTLLGQSVQPQMMFCYKCNQVIPADSVFCPWCKTELFVTCPKCGSRYSSQYPICNRCGTDYDEYVNEQEKKRIKKAAKRNEKKLREQGLNDFLADLRIKREQKAQERILQNKRQEQRIRKTEEYIATQAYILKLLKERNRSLFRVQITAICVIVFFIIIDILLYTFGSDFIVCGFLIEIGNLFDTLRAIIVCMSIICLTVLPLYLWLKSLSAKSRNIYINRYIRVNKIDSRLEPLIIKVVQKLAKLGNASYSEIIESIPKLILTSYKSVYKEKK